MSQSDVHRDLVLRVAEYIEMRYPQVSLTMDIQQKPGYTVPPLIGRYRPDVYAISVKETRLTIIAEAKTNKDIDNRHTENQLSAFINHLERIDNGLFILSVTGWGADLAKTVLRMLCQINCISKTTVAIFDTHDLWILISNPDLRWRLS